MSRYKASKSSFPSLHTENAIEAIRSAVGAMRRRGLKSEHAIADLARDLGVARKRVRTLFYRDGEPVVLADEWHALRVRVAGVLRREANEQRRRADEEEARADELEKQGTLWGTGQSWNRAGYDSKQGAGG